MIFIVHSQPPSPPSPTSHSSPVWNRTNPNRIKHPEQPAHAPGRTSPATSQHPGLRTRLPAPPPLPSKADKTATKLIKTAHPDRIISRKPLHLSASRRRREKVVQTPQPASPTSHSSPVGNRTNPNRIDQPEQLEHANRRYSFPQFRYPTRLPVLRRNLSKTDKTSTKMIKTAHPKRAISRKTLHLSASAAAEKKSSRPRRPTPGPRSPAPLEIEQIRKGSNTPNTPTAHHLRQHLAVQDLDLPSSTAQKAPSN